MTAAPDAAWQHNLSQLIEERIGVRLRLSEPWDALGPFVQARMTALNLPSPTAYLRFLRGEPAHGTEFVRLVAVCTNGQTSFLRDHEQLRGICDCAAALSRERTRPLQVWSAGCSTGEEPYSLAMLFAEAKVAAHITGTDINVEVVRSANQGIFSAWGLRHVHDDMRKRYFVAAGETYKVGPTLRQMVVIKDHNLLQDAPQPPGAARWDIIVCRNVFIYHAPKTMETIVKHMGNALAADGWLFIGASESLHRLDVAFAPVAVGTRHGYRHARADAQAPKPVHVAEPHPETAVYAATQEVPGGNGFENALIDFKAGRYNAALEGVRVYLENEAPTAPAWLLRGHLHLNAHAFSDALNAYQRAQELSPLLAEAHYFQGVVHRKVGALELSEQSFRRVLFLAPDFWPASYLLAGIYERQGRPSLHRKELLATQQTLRGKPVAIQWTVPIETCKSLCIDAETVRRACENATKT